MLQRGHSGSKQLVLYILYVIFSEQSTQSIIILRFPCFHLFHLRSCIFLYFVLFWSFKVEIMKTQNLIKPYKTFSDFILNIIFFLQKTGSKSIFWTGVYQTILISRLKWYTQKTDSKKETQGGFCYMNLLKTVPAAKLKKD